MNAVPNSILGEAKLRLPIAGKIHPGIKALTKAAASNPAAVRAYDAGMSRGLGFDAIERDVRAALKLTDSDKSPLTPRNTPYFRVARAEFGAPETADRILELYGEDRGNGLGRQLYRFPLVLPMDNWMQTMPHGLQSYNARGLQYWSDYDAAGKRFCMTYAGAEIDPRNQRAIRARGGRKQIPRGECLPEACAEYQRGACKLKGQLLFYVPGIPGMGLIAMPSTSFYSMQQMRGQMELVAGLRGGRISGVDHGQPIFTLVKVDREVTKLENGVPVPVKQYLTHLEVAVDMVGMIAHAERLALGAPARMIETLAIEAPPPDPDEPPTLEESTADKAPIGVPDAVTSRNREPTQTGAAVSPGDQVTKLRQEISVLAKAQAPAGQFKGIEFAARMAGQYGADWSTDVNKLAAIKFDLECSA